MTANIVRLLAVAACATACAAGCATTRVDIGAVPAMDAPLEERAVAYDALRPAPSRAPTRYERREERLRPVLVLNDGASVIDARDLAPAVPPGSMTVTHAEQAASLADQAPWWMGAGFLVAGGGAVALAGWTITTTTVEQAFDPSRVEFFAGAFGAVVVGAGIAAVGAVERGEAADETNAAFNAYERDLRARLALKPRPAALAARWVPSPGP